MAAPATASSSVMRRNLLWLFVSQGLTWMMTLVVLVVAPRKLSQVDFGLVSFTTAFVGFFGLVGVLGTGAYITKAVARDPDLLGSYVYNALVMKVLLAVVLSALCLGLGTAFGYSSTILALIGIGLVGMFLSMTSDAVLGGLTGINRLARPAAWSVVQVYLTSLLALTTLFLHMGVLWFAAAYAVGGIPPAIANTKGVWQFVRGHTHIDLRIWKRIVTGGFPLLILSGLILIYGSIDTPLLEWLAGPKTVGVYALAYRWVAIPVFISTIVVSVTSPSLSSLAHHDPGRFAALANRSIRFVLAISIPAATGMVIIAFDLMNLLYHDKYDGAALIIRILAIHIPLVTLSTVLGAVLYSADRQGRFTKVALIAAIANPPMTIGLIKLTLHLSHNGAIGAAIATVLTEVMITVGAFLIRPKGVLDRATGVFVLRCLLANALMAAPLLVFDHLELFVKAIIGAILYAVASLLFRTFRMADIRRAVEQVRGARRSRGQQADNPEVSEHVVPEEH